MRKTGVLVVLSLILIFSLFPQSSHATTPWTPNTVYKVGDMVTYQGQDYKCTFAHTSLEKGTKGLYGYVEGPYWIHTWCIGHLAELYMPADY
ncbi:carbohydrate-binding protein [Brevibacillus fortis]|uniref:carbohydrate-binding protein n=1 Tax=Brevibacillus fortis TaxID=2126352 RepID=UPI0038FCF405